MQTHRHVVIHRAPHAIVMLLVMAITPPNVPAAERVEPNAAEEPASYTVVVSQATFDDAEWRPVVAALKKKHKGTIVRYATAVDEVLPQLRDARPRYTCFVAQPTEASRDFVAKIHQLTRQLDDDPYTDTLWGILTGYDAACALRIAKLSEPLTIRKVASGTEVELSKCEEGVWYCELQQNRMVRKKRGSQPEQHEVPADTTKALVDLLNDYQPDLFITSGHATEHNWQIGFTYKNGHFRCRDGHIFGEDTQGNKHPVQSGNPKVFMPIGNCLMGHIDGTDAMALAYMNSAGMAQMLGYTVPTWYGYAGWGCLDYFVEQPGRYTFVEAFFANHHALVHRLENNLPNSRGLMFDRDTLALYGDPAWHARMADGPKSWKQSLTQDDGLFTLQITPNLGEHTFEPVNINGSERGYRPIVAYLPRRIGSAEVLDGADLNPVITDDFVLVPLPEKCDPSRDYKVVFRATELVE